MKLKKKKTGEIVDAEFRYLGLDAYGPDGLNIGDDYLSIAKLCEEWEDAPEEYYYICHDGEVRSDADDLYTEDCKLIGNYFSTKAEAEKAVEKLKALAQAKRDGLRFSGWHYNDDGLVILANTNKIDDSILETLFGEKV